MGGLLGFATLAVGAAVILPTAVSLGYGLEALLIAVLYLIIKVLVSSDDADEMIENRNERKNKKDQPVKWHW